MKETPATEKKKKKTQNTRQIGVVAYSSFHSGLCLHVSFLQGEISFPRSGYLENFPFYRPQVGDDVEFLLLESTWKGYHEYYAQEVEPLLSHQVTGTCAFWKNSYGFIETPDCAVHVKATDLWNVSSLRVGDNVRFTLTSSQEENKRPYAKNVRRIRKISTSSRRSRSNSVVSSTSSRKSWSSVTSGLSKMSISEASSSSWSKSSHKDLEQKSAMSTASTTSSLSSSPAPSRMYNVRGRCIAYYKNDTKCYGFLQCRSLNDNEQVYFKDTRGYDVSDPMYDSTYDIRKGDHVIFTLIEKTTGETTRRFAVNLVHDFEADLVRLRTDIKNLGAEISAKEFSASTTSDMKKEKQLLKEAKDLWKNRAELKRKLKVWERDFAMYGAF